MTKRPAITVSVVAIVGFTALCLLALAGCAGESEPRTPDPAPEVALTEEETEVWAPLPPDRSSIPVLLYHGIGSEREFEEKQDTADAEYGVDPEDFAKQMTMMKHAGYQTIDLETFLAFVAGEQVDLPPRPVLLTFDDARADSWTGSDAILEELGYNAVVFVDVGRVDDGEPNYLTWEELETAVSSGRWETQLHSGHGHVQIRYGLGEDDFGPFYAYKELTEDFDNWQKRVRDDIEWGQETLVEHIESYQPRAFAPPYGNYGQDGTNDERIPEDLLPWLVDRYGAVFTQDVNARAKPGSGQPLGRIQVTRGVTGGTLYERLLSGEQ
jgi:peptidoglycan/xylan/chitin deacetylase (PgdA/CDA1 family)